MVLDKDIPKKLKRNLDLKEFFERTTIQGILGSWLLVILFFGIAYFGISTFTDSHLLSYTGRYISPDAVGLGDAIYFSAVTGTALGFGDIMPTGFNKLLAALESILGLILYGLLISKIVSVKQQAILEEVYELSFEDNVLRLRSSLHVSRNDFEQMRERVDSGELTRKHQGDIWAMITLFDTNLYNITKLIAPRRASAQNDFARKLDDFRLELILNSIATCVQRLLDLYQSMKTHRISITNEMLNEVNASICRSLGRIIARYGSQRNDRIATRVGELEKRKVELEDITLPSRA